MTFFDYNGIMPHLVMSGICLTARRMGTATITHCRYVSITPYGNLVPNFSSDTGVSVWNVSFSDITKLDRKYDYPSKYMKIELKAEYKGKRIKGFTYICNDPQQDDNVPVLTRVDKALLREAYSNAGIDIKNWPPYII